LIRVAGTGLEVEALIPGSGLVILGMHEQRANAGDQAARGSRR
jgi:hypothetical protein